MTSPVRHFYEFGPFRLDPVEHQLFRYGTAMRLTPKAFETLLVLVGRSAHLVGKEELLKAVWPDSFVEESGLTRNISVLRRILGESDDQKFIETVPKRGYRFVANVKVVRDDSAEPIVKQDLTGRIISNQSETSAELRSLAVLPFKPIGAWGSGEYLGLGMADTLITKLSNIRQIVIRPTGSVLKYREPEQDPQAAGRELRVETVLDGSVQTGGDRIRVTVRLIRVRDGTPLWAETFDEEFAHIFKVQDSISEKVARALLLRLTGEEMKRLTRRYTDNTEAYQFYLKGRYFWNKRTPGGLERGIEYFQKAIESDPSYALSYAGLADSYNQFERYGLLPAKEGAPRGKAAALKALEIDNTLAEGHASLAHAKLFWDWDWVAAEREFKRAIELNPSYADAHLWYAAYLSAMGRQTEALSELKRAQELDPLSLIINTMMGRTFYFARQYDQAINQLRKTLEMDPGFERAHLFLGRAYAQKAMFEEAISELHQALVLSGGNPTFIGGLGYAYGRSGKKGKARKLLDELGKLAQQRYVSAYNIALVYVGLGENGQALEWLQSACEERSSWVVFLSVIPEFDGLRSEPRFVELLRRIGLPH